MANRATVAWMSQSTSAGPVLAASRVASLVGHFDREPAYAGLAEALRLLVGEGRIPEGARLPSERDLTLALGVSRTTVARAYGRLRETGWAEAHQGSGTYTRVPGGRARVQDRALMPAPDRGAIDLGCAAHAAPPGLTAAFAAAAEELPAYLGGHGYFPAGLPRLQAVVAAAYDARGLTTDPDQVMITPGALSAAAVVAQALVSPGDRAAVEDPVYPNAPEALRRAGGRLVGLPVDPAGWDLDAVGAVLGRARPGTAYLVPDFQNPTGHLLDDEGRERYADHLRRAGTVGIVDEAHQPLRLDEGDPPLPFAAHAGDVVTLGSASKSFWGGLRLGWIRAPRRLLGRLTRSRVALDLGAPVLEQLALVHLLEQGPVLPGHLDRLRTQRDTLAGALTERLPGWAFHRPGGGLSLWCRIPEGSASDLAEEAARRGVIVTPGPVFAVEGGLDRYVRIPWTRPAAELEEAVDLLAAAWDAVRSGRPGRVGSPPRHERVVVA
jgi:DNA-binding transcriptional MocR family regulator